MPGVQPTDLPPTHPEKPTATKAFSARQPAECRRGPVPQGLRSSHRNGSTECQFSASVRTVGATFIGQERFSDIPSPDT